MSNSQNQAILARLKRGPLTTLDALREIGSFRLAARIFELRLAGYNIVSDTIKLPNDKRVARYRLLEGRAR